MNHIKTFSSMVALSHTVFALPFALSMLTVVSRDHEVSFAQVLLIILAMFFARTAAMAFNRIIDRDIDGANPRTQTRELPSGKLSLKFAYYALIFCSIGFFVASFLLGVHCLLLSPLVLALLLFYSVTKRFTWGCHVILGLCLGLAPAAVWYAITVVFALKPLSLSFSVMLWVLGFDIIYSCQDYRFDKENNLFSVPAKFGLKTALRIAMFSHLLAIFGLVVFGILFELGIFYLIGVILFSILLINQHLVISEHDLSKVNRVFFTRNGLASVAFFVFVYLDFVFSA